MSLRELLPAAGQVSTLPASVAVKTRRRPGRLKKVSPDLVELLRSPARACVHEPSLGEADLQLADDDLASVKGIVFALALCMLFWASISVVVLMVIR